MKVKMFWVGANLAAVEGMIEEWFSENPDIEIKYILQCADGDSDDTAALISIWYIEGV